MSRPPFSLTDQQAKALLEATAPLRLACPLDPRNHRPFVAGFIRAVYQVTGRTYGPDIYRRLLSAYAPDRKPSNGTLMMEKGLFESNMAGKAMLAALPQADMPAGRGTVAESATNAAIYEGVQRALKEFAPLMHKLITHSGENTHDVYFRYLQQRVEETEVDSAQVKARVAALEAQLLEAQCARDIYCGQLDCANTALTAHADAAAKFAEEHAELRKFALMSIEGARGEARDLKELCRQLKTELQQRDAELDALRKRSYQEAMSATIGASGDRR